MIEHLNFGAALLLGLLGSTHCLGMCGGIAATIGLHTPQNRLSLLLTYNAGRIISYMLAGAIVGSVGILVKEGAFAIALRTMAALLLIAMGLYVANWWKGLVHIERLGHRLWRFIQPSAGKLLPVKNLPQAMLLGFFWGWLPCGLVYSTLIWSATASNSIDSALLMAGFGLGTLPAMLTTGLLATQVKTLLSQRSVQTVSGIMIIAFGIYTLPLHAFTGH